MLKQFGVIYTGKTWRVTGLHGGGDVLNQGVRISDHPTRAKAIAKAREYGASHKLTFPEDETRVVAA